MTLPSTIIDSDTNVQVLHRNSSNEGNWFSPTYLDFAQGNQGCPSIDINFSGAAPFTSVDELSGWDTQRFGKEAIEPGCNYPAFQFPPRSRIRSDTDSSDDSVRSAASTSSTRPPSLCLSVNTLCSEPRQYINRPPRAYQCSNCPKNFKYRSDFSRHCRESHTERDRILLKNRCPEIGCERSQIGFLRRWNLRKHFRTCHGGGELPPEPGMAWLDHAWEPFVETSSDETSSTGVPPLSSIFGPVHCQTIPAVERTGRVAEPQQQVAAKRETLFQQKRQLEAQRNNIDERLRAIDTKLANIDVN